MQTHREYCTLKSQQGKKVRQKPYQFLHALLQNVLISIASTYMVLTADVAATYYSSWGAGRSTLCFTSSSLSAQQLCIAANVLAFYKKTKAYGNVAVTWIDIIMEDSKVTQGPLLLDSSVNVYDNNTHLNNLQLI